MAISILKQPSKYSPSNNPLFLSVQSDNPNVVYFSIVIKSAGAIVSTLKIYPTPDAPTIADVDLSTILRNYTSTPIANSSGFITSFSNGYLSYSIEVADNVGGTLVINDLVVYNADLNDSEFSFYGYRNHYVNSITPAKFLSTKPSINKINPWSKEYLYFLADSNSTLAKIRITTYNADGVATNYDTAINVGANKLHRLNISPKHLKTTLSIDFDTITRFTVSLLNSSDAVISEVKSYTCINLQCGNEPVNVVWLNKFGGLDSFTFINPKEQKTVKRSTYKANKYINHSISNNGVINQSEKTYNVSSTSDYTLNSPILNDWEFVFLTDMLASEQVFVELNDGSLYPIILKTTSAEVKRKRYQTTSPRFQFSYEAESNLNLVPDSYLTFASGLSQIGFNVPTLLSVPNNYFETLIGDGTSLYFTINHNLQSVNIAIDLVYVSNGQTVFGDVVRIHANTISVEFGEAIASNSVKVMISKLD